MKDTLFTIPYWKFKLSNWAQSKKDINSLLKQYPCIKHEDQNFLTNRRLPPDKASVFLNECLKLFADPLQEFVQEIKSNLKVTRAFATAYDKGHDHLLHNHGKSLFTLMAYIDLDPKNHSGTIYKQPFNQFDSGNVAFTIPEVAEGDITIFPSIIEHFSPVNSSSKRKTIIAMDLDFHDQLNFYRYNQYWLPDHD